MKWKESKAFYYAILQGVVMGILISALLVALVERYAPLKNF